MRSFGKKFIALLLLLLLLASPIPAFAEEAGLEVHFLDVGEADATVVFCEGQTMLIDGGNVADSQFIYAWLKEHGVEKIDVMVCTHPHEDHVGGLSAALNAAECGIAYMSVTDYGTKACQSFLKYLEEGSVPLVIPAAGDRFMLGSAEVTVLGPVTLDAENLNNCSLVLRLDYGETAFLFMADAETEEEDAILASGADVSCQVLRVGHHGSGTSSGKDFVAAASPEIAVVSVGENTYGHPHENILARYESLGAAVYRTDECGEIVCRSDGESVRVETEKENP